MNSGSKRANFNGVSGKSATTSSKDKRNAADFGKSINTTSKLSTPNLGSKSSTYNNNSKTVKNSFDERGSSKSNKIPKIVAQSTSTFDKNSISPSSVNQKNKKSSLTFGIIWLPTRKRNKLKESVYNPYDNEKRDRNRERSPSMYNFMSGDSSDRQIFTKKEEESGLLVSDQTTALITDAAGASDSMCPEIGHVGELDLQEVQKCTDEKSKDAGGDNYENEKNDYPQKKATLNKVPETTSEKESDKVDSVYLRPPPPHKARRSNASTTTEGEDCDITCLYYTLQCCDCVIS
ncbi:uncharacterized protein [Battus philenor]|uniref:uncharacterized protein n=1 Tax=Battus philenor TaxID=42288 RepID=UPI0035D0ED4D